MHTHCSPEIRSSSQAEILAAILLHPDREQTITDLSRRLGIPLATVSDEVAHLVEARILTHARSAAPICCARTPTTVS